MDTYSTHINFHTFNLGADLVRVYRKGTQALGEGKLRKTCWDGTWEMGGEVVKGLKTKHFLRDGGI